MKSVAKVFFLASVFQIVFCQLNNLDNQLFPEHKDEAVNLLKSIFGPTKICKNVYTPDGNMFGGFLGIRKECVEPKNVHQFLSRMIQSPEFNVAENEEKLKVCVNFSVSQRFLKIFETPVLLI